MNELVNQLTAIVANVPTFVWGIAIAFLLLIVGIVITVLIYAVKYLRGGAGLVITEYARMLVVRGFDQIRKIVK